MDVVDAYWERRNLGVTCTELTLDPRDSASDLRAELMRVESDYQVVKVPVARPDIMHELVSRGFFFMEASVAVEHRLRLPDVSPVLTRIAQATTCTIVPPDETDRVIEQVHAGLFDTDRVYLDSRFDAAQAAMRYVNWIEDELRAGATLHEIAHAGQAAGFFLFREGRGRTGLSALSGLYDRAGTPGMGLVLLYLILQEAAARGMRVLSSHISTNNLAVVKTHVTLGFDVIDIHYVFVKHRDEGPPSDGKR